MKAESMCTICRRLCSVVRAFCASLYLAGYHLLSSKRRTRNLCESYEAARGHFSRVRGPRPAAHDTHRETRDGVCIHSGALQQRPFLQRGDP